MPPEALWQGQTLDGLVAGKAYYQHGLITVGQLKALGVSRAAIRTRLRRGQWVMAARGVVRITGTEITWESQLLAQVLSAGGGAMASHRSAAALWKLDGFRRPGKPELVIPRARSIGRSQAIVHRSRDLHLIKPVKLNRVIPATPIERTLLDVGSVSSRTALLLAVDDARRRRLTDWGQLLKVVGAHARRGRGGVATLRSIVHEHVDEVAATDSGFERLVLILLAESGLPKPTLQHEVHLAGRTYRIDLAYLDQRIAIELNGLIHLDRRVWEKDHMRYAALANAGWLVLPFTWRHYRTNPSHLVREVRKALGRRQSTTNRPPT